MIGNLTIGRFTEASWSIICQVPTEHAIGFQASRFMDGLPFLVNL